MWFIFILGFGSGGLLFGVLMAIANKQIEILEKEEYPGKK